jgi:hypothetical protein
MKNSQKGFVVPLLIVIAVLVIGGGIYYYSRGSSKPTSYLNADLTNTYTVLANEDRWRTKLITSENPEAWLISSKNITVKATDYQGNFSCGDKKAEFIKYSSYNTGAVGGWGSVSIVDCGSYYFVFEYADSGPKLFGPFDQVVASQTSQSMNLSTLANKKESVENRLESLRQLMLNPNPEVYGAVNTIVLDKTDSFSVRDRAMKALVQSGGNIYLKTFEKISSDPTEDKNLRAVATLQLGILGTPESVSVLIGLLSDKDSLVQFKAAQALGETKSTVAYDSLIKIAQNNSVDSQLRARSILTIGEIKVGNCAITPTLLGLLNDEKDNFLKISYITAIGTIKCQNAINGLLQYVNGTNELLKINAQRAIDSINSSSI